MEFDEENSELYDEAVAFVKSAPHPSVSAIQRKFKVGYGRAMGLVNEMVRKGDWPMTLDKRGNG